MDLFHSKEEIISLWDLKMYANSLLNLANPRKDVFIQMYVNTIKYQIQTELNLYSKYEGRTIYRIQNNPTQNLIIGKIISIKRFSSSRVIAEVKFVTYNEPVEIDLSTLVLI